MIIQCINCSKKFDVDSNLIPVNGRNIQCGSCDHTWFYKPDSSIEHENLSNVNNKDKISKVDVIEKVHANNDKEDNLNRDEIIINDGLTNNSELIDKEKTKITSHFSIGRILSYIVVTIITFVTLIIILDTLKSPLSNKFPRLELILYNLFETIKDIFLFLKNLLV